MRGSKVLLAIGGITLMWIASVGAAEKPVHKFVGAEKCKMCHNSPAKGAQYKVWTESKHSKAYAALATDAAKAIAKAKGIADAQKSADCLKCHVTGYGQPAENFVAPLKPEDGVQCETCHGPGSDYKAMAVMKGVRAKTTEAASVGLVMPTAETCTQCHNDQSPSFKSFNFSEDSTRIAHPIAAAAAK